MMTQKRERLLLHYFNCDYVSKFHERLRKIRGARSQMYVACMSDVVQSYISRVESGMTNGIGPEALRRILQTYRELEQCS